MLTFSSITDISKIEADLRNKPIKRTIHLQTFRNTNGRCMAIHLQKYCNSYN